MKQILEAASAHNMLIGGLISAVLGEQFPGHGTVSVGQTLRFVAPVRPGAKVRASVIVLSLEHFRRRVTLKTVASAGERSEGRALAFAPSRTFD